MFSLIRRSAPLLVALAMAGSVAAMTSDASATTASCDPVRSLTNPTLLPPAYRSAVEALVEATSRPGKPWSCSGGTIAVTLRERDGGATITILDAHAREARRDVESPEDLRAVAEALLAAPVIAAAPSITDDPEPKLDVKSPGEIHSEPERDLERPTANAPLPQEPRLVIEALVGPRVSGPIASGWGSGEIRGTIPLDPYEVALWVRLSLPFASNDLHPEDLSWQDTSVGLGLGRRILRLGTTNDQKPAWGQSRFDLAGRFDAGLSVVTMDSGHRREGNEADGARIALRLGVGVKASFPFGSAFRGVAIVDGALAPTGLLSNDKIAPGLPDVPIYSFGLSLGAEAKIQ